MDDLDFYSWSWNGAARDHSFSKNKASLRNKRKLFFNAQWGILDSDTVVFPLDRLVLFYYPYFLVIIFELPLPKIQVVKYSFSKQKLYWTYLFRANGLTNLGHVSSKHLTSTQKQNRQILTMTQNRLKPMEAINQNNVSNYILLTPEKQEKKIKFIKVSILKIILWKDLSYTT